MNDERLAMLLSAYADGEVSAEDRRAVEAALSERPELRQQIAIFQRLGQSARALPVPSVEDRFRAQSRAVLRLEQAAAAEAVPTVPAERFNTVWQTVRERTALPKQLVNALDTAAASEQVPQPTEERYTAAWEAILARTHGVDAATAARLDDAARALPVPRVNELDFERVWERVLERTVEMPAKVAGLDATPALDAARWQPVWTNIKKKTGLYEREQMERGAAEASPASVTPAATPAPVAPAANVEQVEFAPRRRRGMVWAVAAGLAAAASLAFMLWPRHDDVTNPIAADTNAVEVEPKPRVALAAPQVADERYRVSVKLVEGQEQPVVCFYLKDDDTGDSLRWLPN